MKGLDMVPDVDIDTNFLDMLTAVGKGWLPVAEGIAETKRLLKPAIKLIERDPQLTAVAIRTVERLYPRSVGLLMSDEEISDYWTAPGPPPHLVEMRFALLVVSCLQVTSTGELRAGAKAVQQALDQLVPQDC